MSLDEELQPPPAGRRSAVTIGVFDGVHRGHRHLIDRLAREARADGLLAGVVTFGNHPMSVLRPGARVEMLTDLDERVRLLRETGVDFVAPVTFDRDLAALTAAEFLAALRDRLAVRKLVVGPDFAMGRGRDGNSETLPALARSAGLGFVSVERMTDPAGVVKSAAIRRLIAAGDVSGAARLLGRDFSVRGVVVHGQRRGRELGYPTANVDVPPGFVVPADGIYATWASVAGGEATLMAATRVGSRPTFDDGDNRTIEAFLLDFSGDIYGRAVRLDFARRLRGEEKFDSVEALLERMDEDVRRTRALLSAARLPRF